MKSPELSQGLAWPRKIRVLFQMRVVAEVHRPRGIFNVLPFLLEPLRAGAELEDLQDQSVEVKPPPTLLAVDRVIFLDWVVADIHSPDLPWIEVRNMLKTGNEAGEGSGECVL